MLKKVKMKVDLWNEIYEVCFLEIMLVGIIMMDF